MKILDAATLLVSLVAGLTNALPTPNEVNNFGPSGVSAVDDTRIKHVLDVMEADTGPLNWKTFNDSGALLTIPTDEWDKYANLAGIMSDIQTVEERAAEATYSSQVETRDILRRATLFEVPGGINGHIAWGQCYDPGTWAHDEQISRFIPWACWAFEVQGVLNTLGTTGVVKFGNMKNAAGDMFSVYFHWGYNGFLHFTVADCNVILNLLVNNYCQGSDRDTRGGRIVINTGVVGGPSWLSALVVDAEPRASSI
ncbi:hypothetical protein BDZ91DRAFT_846315 [Kalaharituber pfeilii]|nr:hypothetical protein BDZ91DRAFT_846315 [Kalaharituber pfeilii]